MITFLETESGNYQVCENGAVRGNGSLTVRGNNRIYIALEASGNTEKEFLFRALLNVCRQKYPGFTAVALTDPELAQTFGFIELNGETVIETRAIRLGCAECKNKGEA